jgi:hypothetical protein
MVAILIFEHTMPLLRRKTIHHPSTSLRAGFGTEDTEKNWAKVKSHHGFTRMSRIGLRQDKGKIHRSVAEDTRKNGQKSKATTDLHG